MKPPAYAACSLRVPAIRREEDADDRPKGDISSGASVAVGLAAGASAAGVAGEGAAGAGVLSVVAPGVAVSVGEGVADAVSLGVGDAVAVAVALLLAEVVGLGVGVTSAWATDGIPKVSATSANGAVTRTRRAVRSMWWTAFLSGS
ncbi:hypothetical protein ASG74_01135 [Knoellia sp. Soil729]|nr:hypothetical protein ASG74_01135 [Knoellia sp. Soil729]